MEKRKKKNIAKKKLDRERNRSVQERGPSQVKQGHRLVTKKKSLGNDWSVIALGKKERVVYTGGGQTTRLLDRGEL